MKVPGVAPGNVAGPEQTSGQAQHSEGPRQGEPLPPQHYLALQRPQQPVLGQHQHHQQQPRHHRGPRVLPAAGGGRGWRSHQVR